LSSSEPAATELLQANEPHPLETFNEHANSPYLLICEHAGRRLPAALGNLGLSEGDLQRHIAWDIGARAVALKLSERLNAPLYMQRYSRLVCDCNRRPDVPTFIVERSENTDIPGNVGLSPAERDARARAIFWPFHDPISAALDRRQAETRPTILLTIHSFTPVFHGQSRPWEIGVLFNRDRIMAPSVAQWLRRHTSLCVGINQPYRIGDDTDYAIPVHGEERGLPCIEFEIRNDLIPDDLSAERCAETIQMAVSAVAKMGLLEQ
jgi:predicted N-formylglutamate amidohydrolase